MKKQLLYFSMVGMLLTMNACDDDGKTEFLDDYSTIMYFTNSGIQNVECLKVGEPTTYNIAVYKAGRLNGNAYSLFLSNASILSESKVTGNV